MRTYLAALFSRVAGWLRSKAVPPALTGAQWSGTSFIDAYRRNRAPTPNEILAELKNTAWTCASINAAVCASFPPRLYVTTMPNQARPKCLTKSPAPAVQRRLRAAPHLAARIKSAERIEEVTDHPILDLLAHANPVMNAFDLWELTTLYQEVHGGAYWFLDVGPLGAPQQIWMLPSQNVTPRREPNSPNLVDYYLYRTGTREQRFRPDRIIHFRYPDPRDPYTGGLSPLRACYEQAALTSEYAAFKRAKFDNHAIPDAIVSPDEVIGEEERDRLEAQWNSRFRKGGGGKVVVAESALRVQLLAHSMGDLAALADMKATKEDVCNAFHVPISFLSSETNLANLQAAEHQHMSKAVTPRLQRRDEKLNEQLLPLFDPTGRLFLASEDPVPVNRDLAAKEQDLNLKYGVNTINEIRGVQGLEPVPWGDAPWLPRLWAQTNDPNRNQKMSRKDTNAQRDNEE
ncbi:MAG TPA: phage portal protein [Gemmataceae bacterium]|nr:phage portal protein [Gemmataceae bacterium]